MTSDDDSTVDDDAHVYLTRVPDHWRDMEQWAHDALSSGTVNPYTAELLQSALDDLHLAHRIIDYIESGNGDRLMQAYDLADVIAHAVRDLHEAELLENADVILSGFKAQRSARVAGAARAAQRKQSSMRRLIEREAALYTGDPRRRASTIADRLHDLHGVNVTVDWVRRALKD